MGVFEQLFGPVRGEFEPKFFKNSNAREVARGEMLKLRFHWYITRRENEGTEREAPIRQALGYVNSAEVIERLQKTAKVRFFYDTNSLR